MNIKILKAALAAIAFAVVVSISGVASAGVTSAAIGNIAVINDQIIDTVTAPIPVHYRYYNHSHQRRYNPPRRYAPPRRYERKEYYEGCRRVKKRFAAPYGGYHYRWVRVCY